MDRDLALKAQVATAVRTGIFIGGKNAIQALDMMEAAKKAQFPPFEMCVFADPAGSFTARALTRNADSAKARELAAQGVELFEADLDDEASLRKAW